MTAQLDIRKPWFGQFLLQPRHTPHTVSLPSEWQTIDLGHFALRVCPSVPIAQVTTNHGQAVMLGHAFSTVRRASRTDTLHEIAEEPHTQLRMARSAVESLAGRFVLFIWDGSRLRIVPDPVVSFKVVWGQDSSGQTQAASDVKLLRASGGFQPNNRPEWQWARMQPKFQRMGGYPIGHTPLEGVRPLPANQILDLDGPTETSMWRAFPKHVKEKRGRAEVQGLVYEHLAQVFQNAADEGLELWFPITSGQDSRFIAAAAHKAHLDGWLRQPVQFYFIEKEFVSATGKVDRAHVEFLRKQGVPITIFKARTDKELADIDPPFVPLAHHSFLSHLTFRLALNDGTAFPINRLFAMANTAENIKFMHDAPDAAVPKEAARGLGYPNHRFVLAYFGNWMRDAQPHAKNTAHFVHELAWWESVLEHFSGNMLHSGNGQVPMWCPMNFHRFYELGHSMDLSERDHHTSRFFRLATADWWPLLGTFPLNPDRRTRAIIALKRLGLYRLYRPWGQRYRWWASGRAQRRAERQNLK